MKKAIILFSLFFTSTVYAKVHYILPYESLMRLSETQRNDYIRKTAKGMILLEGKDHRRNSSIWSLFVSTSYAATDEPYLCIGGGVPVPSDVQNCGVSEYSGFKCSGKDEGLEICNPLIFGLKADGSPFCYKNATTKKCYQNIVTGKNSFFKDEFFNKPEIKKAYRKFKNSIDSICSGEVKIKESRRYRDEACSLIKKQTRVNQLRADRGQLNISYTGYGSFETEAVENVRSELADGSESAVRYLGESKFSPLKAKTFIDICKKNKIKKELCRDLVTVDDLQKRAFQRTYGKRSGVIHLVPGSLKWQEGAKLLKVVQDAQAQYSKICGVKSWYIPQEFANNLKVPARISGDSLDIKTCGMSVSEKEALVEYLKSKGSVKTSLEGENSITIILN